LNIKQGDKFSIKEQDGGILLEKFATIELDLWEFKRDILEFLLKESCEKDISVNEVISNIMEKVIESDNRKKSLDTVTVNLSSIADDSPYYFPRYPDIIGSWNADDTNPNYGVPNPDYVDSFDLPTYFPPSNPEDILAESQQTDEYGFKMNYDVVDFVKWTPRDRRTKLDDKVENEFGKIIYKIPVYELEWEADGWWYIVEKDDKRFVVVTDHGHPMEGKKQNLENKIHEYKDLIQRTEKAILLLNWKKRLIYDQ
jgi:hypothetical protein